MKRVPIIFLLILVWACSSEKKVGSETPEVKESTEAENEPASPRREASGEANGVAIIVDYGSPAVKGRKIWGGLEKYDRVWRAGANETTSISFDKNTLINGERLDQGKYAFFIIPKEEDNWVVIFNTDWDEWGAFSYQEENDVLRLPVKPEWSSSNQERLQYSIEEGQLIFSWEKVRLSVDVQPAQ